MDLETVQLIQSLGTEAIKILGPAFITYLAAASQFKARLKEIEKTNIFKSREHLFSYYQARQNRLDKIHSEISKGIGMVLGFASTAGNDTYASESTEAFKVLMHTHIAVAPIEIEITLRELKEKNLNDSEEFRQLENFQKMAKKLILGPSNEDLRQCAISLLSIYASLERGNQILLEKKIEAIFG